MKLNAFLLIFITSGLTFIPAAHALKAEGFLTKQTAPDSLAILPPPPAENTVTFQADKALYESGHVLRNPARIELANRDAHYENVGQVFSEAFGMEISASHTPVLYQLLNKVLQDSHDYAVRDAKEHYKRVRPFVIYKDATCTPEKDKKMATTGSYPSGHASFGWATALILAEINPSRKTGIIRRGYDFGQSRVICGAHWQSDVEAGRLMGATIVATLHNNSGFKEMLDEAKKEFAALSSQSK